MTHRWRKTDSNHRFLDSSAAVVKTAVRSPHDGLTVSRPGTRSLNPSPSSPPAESHCEPGRVRAAPAMGSKVIAASSRPSKAEMASALNAHWRGVRECLIRAKVEFGPPFEPAKERERACGQIARQEPVEDRLGDVGSEIAEADALCCRSRTATAVRD